MQRPQRWGRSQMINRRAFARIVGTGAATASLAGLSSASASAAMPGGRKPVVAPTVKPGTHTSFGSLKQINAGVLNIGYAEAGPADGAVVILLHGWPYDIHSYVDVP